MSNAKQKVSLTVVVTGLQASIEVQQVPNNTVVRNILQRTRTGHFTDDTSVDQTCQHLADGIEALSKEYRIIMPHLYQQSLIKRGLIEADTIETDTLHGYESVRIDGSAGSTSSAPKKLRKSDKCRAIIADNKDTEASIVIAMIAEQCELAPALAKKYYTNNLAKVFS